MKTKITVETKAITNYTPDDNALTDVCITNHIVEMRTMDKPHSNLQHFKRISKDEYVDKRTGEVKQYSHTESEQNRTRNLNRSFEKLRQLINANFTCAINELHVILTYASPMNDFDKAAKDFKRFWEKLHYHYPDLEFIRVIEPQHTGTWHIHVLLKSQDYHYLMIPYEELKEFWNHGNVKIVKMKDNDNIGAYFTAFHKNINAFENDSSINTDRKCIVKGARLQFYPTNKRFYSYSKGILKPTSFRTTYDSALKLVDKANLVFSSTTEIILKNIETQEEFSVNTISRLQFNAKRNKKKE